MLEITVNGQPIVATGDDAARLLDRILPAPTVPTVDPTPEPTPEPKPKPKPKQDKTMGGQRRTNGHQLDCSCGTCARAYGATPKPKPEPKPEPKPKRTPKRTPKPKRTQVKATPTTTKKLGQVAHPDTAPVRREQERERARIIAQAEREAERIGTLCKQSVLSAYGAQDLDELETLAQSYRDRARDARQQDATGLAAFCNGKIAAAWERQAKLAQDTLHELLDA